MVTRGSSWQRLLAWLLFCGWTALVAAKGGRGGGGGGGRGSSGGKVSGGSVFGSSSNKNKGSSSGSSGGSFPRNRNGVSTGSYQSSSRFASSRPSSYSTFWNPFYRPYGFYGPAGYYHYGGYYRYSSYNNRHPRPAPESGVCATTTAATNCTRDGGDSAGVLVCRELFSPATGEAVPRTVCVDPATAWDTDTCGCCPSSSGGADNIFGGEDFGDNIETDETTNTTTTIPEETCEDARIDLSFRTACTDDDFEDFGDDGSGSANATTTEATDVVVCRRLFDPYTSAPVRATLTVPSDRALEGDSCGACDETTDDLPVLGAFEAPSASALTGPVCPFDFSATTFCDPTGGEGDAPSLEEDADAPPVGVFVCREFFHPLTGATAKQSVCLRSEFVSGANNLIPLRAWPNDACGCCDGDCPASGTPISLPAPSCSNDDTFFEGCLLADGSAGGIPVCRSLFHPLDGELRLRSLCLDPANDEGWASDTCGCCGEGCEGLTTGLSLPDQLLALAYEDPSFLEPVDYQEDLVFEEAGEDGGGGAVVAFVVVLGVLLLGLVVCLCVLFARSASGGGPNKPPDGAWTATDGGSGFGAPAANPAPAYVSNGGTGAPSSSGGTYAPAVAYAQPVSYGAPASSSPYVPTSTPYTTTTTTTTSFPSATSTTTTSHLTPYVTQ